MAKKINEKTFELNITNELLNLSKSFIWYLDHFHWFNFPPVRNRNIISRYIRQATFFAEGLTQKDECNPLTGGYDVSINFNHPNGQEGRLMFLQYKSGIRKNYSYNPNSNFLRKTAKLNNRTSHHVMFTFNDAAKGTQHSTLRNLANSTNVNPNSVFYVFPRITEITDFKSKIGNLIQNSSFVPVLDIDTQAANQNPPITINDGVSHKYRTSYDGITSEVNFFYFFYYYDNKIISDILSELICVQIERFSKFLFKKEGPYLDVFLDIISDGFNRFVVYELSKYPSKNSILENVNSYISKLSEYFKIYNKILQAPSKYTTVIPKEGLKLNFEHRIDFSRVNYQIF